MAGKVFVTGDTHAYIDMGKLAAKEWPLGKKIDKGDYLIVCGDFGLPWGENAKEDAWWLVGTVAERRLQICTFLIRNPSSELVCHDDTVALSRVAA